MQIAAVGKLLPRNEILADRRDELAAASDDAWLWHVHSMPDALATWHDASDRSFALVASDGTPVAIVPLTSFRFTRARGAVRAANVVSGPGTGASW